MAQQTINVNKTPPDHTGMLIASLVMAIGGWVGLYYLVTTQIPRVGQRWLFFVLVQIAVAGTVMPILRYVNVRLTPITRVPPPSGVIVRQSVWFGLYVVTCAWLQIPRVLTVPMMFFLALAFVVIELFLRSREIPNEQYDADE
ncbi:MAG TPA: hypothetical protein VHD90_20820 [Phototrophicaceae bacterium]|nr:hypothetical protein [Phototrophicaceae bacterium]